VTEVIFERFYAVYDVIRMPNQSKGPRARSAAVRSILKALKSGEGVLLFPEGRNVDNVGMRRVQSGIGSLAILVSRSDVPIVPAAVYHDDDRFIVSFARPLEMTEAQSPEQVEDGLGRRIAELLPSQARGAYAV